MTGSTQGNNTTGSPGAGRAPAATTAASPLPALPAALLETLAARFRDGGLFLAALEPSGGAVTWSDPAAPAFFARFALPMLRHPAPHLQAHVAEAVAQVVASAAPAAWSFFPGLAVAAFPHVDKRHVTGIVLLVGKRDAFALDEDLLRAANRHGLDPAALAQQAAPLPAFTDAAVLGAARLLAGMARDQARLASLEHEIDSLSTQLATSYEELSLIYQVSSGMKVNRGAGEFFRQACLDLREVMGVRAMGFALTGPGTSANAATTTTAGQQLTVFGDAEIPDPLTRRLATQLVPLLRERKNAILVNRVAADHRFSWFAPHARQLIAVPLQRQDEVLGCLFGLDKTAADFDSVDAKLLTSIANESAIYLENAMLFDDVRELMMGVLHSLTSAVDAKDAYTCGHSERVALLSRRLARELRLPEALVERIYMAGILHDVGKIGVPEAVLHKTGKLTDEEFEQMKKHPQIGARILADIKQVQDLIPGVLHHHERYDGRGYPAKLSGENIPLMGRLICIADCFDAMTSNRTYRRALPLEVALMEVRRCAGTQFDPAMAESFLQIPATELAALLKEYQARAPRAVPTPEFTKAA
jgi:HD-GYP domain-containing protein (c-di-GMP phosphodiesterase class II)